MAEIHVSVFDWFAPVHHLEFTRPENLKIGIASNQFRPTSNLHYIIHPIHVSCFDHLDLVQNVRLNNPNLSVGNTLNLVQTLSKGVHVSAFCFLSLHHEARRVKYERLRQVISFRQDLDHCRGLSNQFNITQEVRYNLTSVYDVNSFIAFRSSARIYKANNPDFVLVIDEIKRESVHQTLTITQTASATL